MKPRRSSKTPIPHLPLEIVDLIIQRISAPSDLLLILRVSKAWYRSGIKRLHQSVWFTSSYQRDGFFQMLVGETRLSPCSLLPVSAMSSSASPSQPIVSPQSQSPSRMRTSPNTPCIPILRRKMPVSKAVHPGMLVHSLHFGLGPRWQPHSSPVGRVGVTRGRRHSKRSVQRDVQPLSESIPMSSLADLSTATLSSIDHDRPVTRSMSICSHSHRDLSSDETEDYLHYPSSYPGHHTRLLSIEHPSHFSQSRFNAIDRPPRIDTGRRPSTSPTRSSPSSHSSNGMPSATSATSTTPMSMTTPYSGLWENRRISGFLDPLSTYCPSLLFLSLSGCQINDYDFEDMLRKLTLLERLDISYTTLKRAGLAAVPRYGCHHLQWLNISGIFRLGRNQPDVVLQMALCCTKLTRIVAYECPELHLDISAECRAINGNLELIQESCQTSDNRMII